MLAAQKDMVNEVLLNEAIGAADNLQSASFSVLQQSLCQKSDNLCQKFPA